MVTDGQVCFIKCPVCEYPMRAYLSKCQGAVFICACPKWTEEFVDGRCNSQKPVDRVVAPAPGAAPKRTHRVAARSRNHVAVAY